jgi:hypothetical protein
MARAVAQRRLWWAGGFRHIVVNVDKNAWHMPGWTAYYLGLVTLGTAWKAGHLLQPTSSFSAVRAFVLLLALYCLVTFVANWQVRSPWMLVYPVYAFAQAIAMPTIGAAYFCVLAVRQRRLGRYGFGYRRWWRRATPSAAARRVPRMPRGLYEIVALHRLGVVTPLAPLRADPSSRRRRPFRNPPV